jgi:transposase
MGERKYREYNESFKIEALEMLKRSGKGAGRIEKQLGITPGLLLKWKARYQILEAEGEQPQIGPSDLEGAKAEIRRLQRQLAEAEEEKEILKKALNIFSRKGP